MLKMKYVLFIPAIFLVVVAFMPGMTVEWKIGLGLALLASSMGGYFVFNNVPPAKALTIAGVVILGGLIGFGNTLMTAQASAERLIHIEARQFGFEPGIVRVNKGDWVNLEITSTDVVHGFYLDGYGIDQKIMPGQTTTIRFKADKPGRFGFRCSETCGVFHPFMVGELVIQPNYSYGAALGLAGGIAVGSILFVLWREEE